ncbi:MAG TPA: hypothetical protein VEQ10_10595 [Vicinamibacteria bacterium]|nr:hypothetical protein [Vicinamibacteria bacterium]
MAIRTLLLVAVSVLALGGAALAQEEPAPPKPAGPEATRPDKMAYAPTLRIQLVISRFQGEKKTGSLPYLFTTTVGGDRVRMRMGVDTPVPVGVQTVKEGLPAPSSYQYRNVGTNIDCLAREVGSGRYRLNITVENSSTLASEREGEAASTRPPLFRRFETSLDLVLRDGQTVQTVASTDPVTGEVVKIDVTMNVVK